MFCSWLHRVCTWPCMSSGLATKLTLTRVSRGRLRELGWTCFRSLFCTVICVCCWLIGNTVYLLVHKVTSKAGQNFCDLLLVPYISMYREGPAWKEISCLCRRRYYCEMFSVSYIHQRWSISISLSLITDWTTGVRFVAQTKDIFTVASVPRPALRPIQPPIQLVPGVLCRDVRPGVTLTTHQIQCRSKNVYALYILSPLAPAWRLRDSFFYMHQ
jgi:hypothetical protein